MPILRDVQKTFTFEDQRVEINELALDVYNLQLSTISLTDFSVVVNSPGVANLAYDNAGVFSYTPPDLSSYLQTETDPTVPAFVKAITQTQITNWNNAHSWGNHALAGYITGIGQFGINALADVNTGTIATGEVLKWNGTVWEALPDVGIEGTDLLVTTVSASGGGSLAYNWNTNTNQGEFTFAPADLSGIFSGDYNDLTNKPAPYVLPTASTTVLGGVKIDGTTINIDANGVISGNKTVVTDDTAPSNPNDGDLWWKSDEGQLKVWYDDGNSQQWVDTGGNGIQTGSGSGSGGIGLGDLSATTAAAGTTSLVYDNVSGEFTYTPPDLSAYALSNAISLNSLSDVDASTGLANGKIIKYNGVSWELADDTGGIALTNLSASNLAPGTSSLTYDNSTGVFSYTPPDLSGYITSLGWNYADVSSFPNVGASNLGSLGFAEDIGVLYYSNGLSWTNNRIVVTDDSTTSDFATLLGNYQRTYTLTTADHTDGNNAQNAKRKLIQLTDNIGTINEFTIAVEGNCIAIGKSTNAWGKDEITITGQEYMLTVQSDTPPADSILRLSGIGANASTQDVAIRGLDGILVERIDGQTLGIRAPSQTVTQYTDDMARDAAFAAFDGGTHQNITFTYDSVNRVINANATGGGGGGGGVTYDLQGTNNTSNQAIVQLVPSTGTTDTIEFAGGDGTVVAWDGANSKVTITSVDYSVGAKGSPAGGGDLSLNAGVFTYTPPDLSSYLTTIPIASTTVLGGVKQGANCTIQADGTIDIVQGSYTLPTASTTQLGGVKIDGSSILIDGNGVISSTGGSTVPLIGELTGTSASIADGDRGELSITGHKGYVLYKINVDVESWVRIYCDDTTRQADRFRSEGNDPAPGSGVIAECRTSGANQDVLITPGIMGFNNDNPRTDTIYLSINNRSGSASAITVTLTALKIGE